jgi:peptidoglycan/LPS O-acetylase OafA/YrhL
MLVGGLVFLALCLSYVNSIFYPNFSLPLDANVVLAAMPFFFVGFLCRRRNLDGWRFVAFGASGLTISAYLVLRNVSISIDMREGVYGVPLLSPLLAIGCASFCTSLSKVASSRFVGEPLRRLGELSMGIMFIHKEIEDLPGYALLERTSSLLAFLVSLTLSFALSYLVSRFSITRAFLLGSEADIESLGQSANAAARS